MPENNEEQPKKILNLEDEEIIKNLDEQLVHRTNRLQAAAKERPLKQKLREYIIAKFSTPDQRIAYDEFHTENATVEITYRQTAKASVFGEILQKKLDEKEKVSCSKCGTVNYINYGDIIAEAEEAAMDGVPVSTAMEVSPRK